MSDVFDILMRIGVTDEITHVLRDVGSALSEIHGKVGDLHGNLASLAGSMTGISAAMTGLAGAVLLGGDKIAQFGDKALGFMTRLDVAGLSAIDTHKAWAAAWQTTHEVMGATVEENLEMWAKLQAATKSADIATALLPGMQKLQELNAAYGGGGDVTKLFRSYLGMGLKEPEAFARTAADIGTITKSEGNITYADHLRNMQQMQDAAQFFTRDFIQRVFPVLEMVTPAGSRQSVGRAMASEFTDAMRDRKGMFSSLMLPGTLRGIENDPYAIGQSMAQRFANMPDVQRYGGLGSGRIEVAQIVEEALTKAGFSGAMRSAMEKFILQGGVALGGRSPFQQPLQAFDLGKAYEQFEEAPGEKRKAMYTAIHDFIVSIGVAVDKLEAPLLDKIGASFRGWADSIREMDPEKLDRIIRITAVISGVVGGLGVLGLSLSALGFALRGLAPVAALFSVPGVGALAGLAAIAAVGVDLYNNWEKNKGLAENISGELHRIFQGIAFFLNNILGLKSPAISTGDFRSPLTLDSINRALGRGESWPHWLTRQGMGPVTADELMPTHKMLTDPRLMGPTGGIGMLPPASFGSRFGPFGDKPIPPSRYPSFDLFNQGDRGGAASPASYTPGGAITPRSSEGRAKGVTIATSLNIDGRLLAELVTQHVVEMLSDPSSASAPDWLSTPHGPGAGYSAA